MGTRILFYGHENVLELNSGDHYITEYIKNHWIAHLKSEFYVNSISKKSSQNSVTLFWSGH